MEDNEGFISDETVERYNQDWQDGWHGTPHTLLENRIMIDAKMGTGEGTQAFGWGGYVGQTKATGNFYRGIGLPNHGKGTIHIHTNDGITYSSKGDGTWDNSPDIGTQKALRTIVRAIFIYPNADIEELKVRSKEYLTNVAYSYSTERLREDVLAEGQYL